MRRLAAAVLLAAGILMPAVASPPVAQAAVCTGWSSTTTPPTTIRVLRTGPGTVATVDFETYVKVVVAAELPHAWPTEVLRAAAVAIKQYAWYYAMHWRGGSATGGCYDVVDSSNDQVYSPETKTLYLSQIQAVESTWPESITRNGAFVFTGYRPGSSNVCGSDVDGARLYQKSARGCALAGMTGEQILQLYYGPGIVVQGAPDQSATTYHPLAPARILDTVSGTGGLTGPLTSHVAKTFQVTGKGGVPAGATAVTGNLTVTQQTSLGYLFIGPVAMNDPASSNLNFPAGDDRANGVTVALGSGGTLSITYAASNLTATAQAIFDVTGYFTPDMTGATYFPLPPARILDTRPTPSGSPTVGGLVGPIGSQVAKTFQVTGKGGVPAGATAVTGNLTVTGQTSAGSLYLGPAATAKPAIATLDFPVADNRADGVTMMLGSGGTLSFTLMAPASGQTAQVVFDVTGYFLPGTSSGDTYHSLTPTRLLDSRPTAKSGNPLNIGLSGAFRSHVARSFQVTGIGGVPSSATAVTGNLTVTQQTSLGFLYIGPAPMNNPTSSSLNFPKGDNRANEVTVALGSGGKLSVTYAASSSSSTAQAIFDVAGYFTPAG